MRLCPREGRGPYRVLCTRLESVSFACGVDGIFPVLRYKSLRLVSVKQLRLQLERSVQSTRLGLPKWIQSHEYILRLYSDHRSWIH